MVPSSDMRCLVAVVVVHFALVAHLMVPATSTIKPAIRTTTVNGMTCSAKRQIKQAQRRGQVCGDT
jgi:hypothetical protein